MQSSSTIGFRFPEILHLQACVARRAIGSPHYNSTVAANYRPRVARNVHCCSRTLSSATILRAARNLKSSDRGPSSTEDTQTDFGSMNVLGNTPAPTTAIDACLSDGFHFDSGLKIGGGSGCLLVGGEAFSWRPWEAGSRPQGSGKGRMINKKGQWDVENEAWGILDLVWPKPGTTLDLPKPLVREEASWSKRC